MRVIMKNDSSGKRGKKNGQIAWSFQGEREGGGSIKVSIS